MISNDKIRDEIKLRPCEKCGKPIPAGEDYILTFFRGNFIVLHEKCGDFINNPFGDKPK
jgi:hypothetical protein